MDGGVAIETALPERRSRMSAWLRRYGPAELAGTCAALAAAALATGLRSDGAAAAAAWAEAVAFYGVVLWRDARGAGARRALGDAVLEFGPAEAFDLALARPLLLVACAHMLGLVPGVLVGKLLADVLFYCIAIRSRLLIERRRA